MIWNVKGLGSPSKKAQIKHEISFYSPDFMCFSETKLNSTNKAVMKFILSSISINGFIRSLMANLEES